MQLARTTNTRTHTLTLTLWGTYTCTCYPHTCARAHVRNIPDGKQQTKHTRTIPFTLCRMQLCSAATKTNEKNNEIVRSFLIELCALDGRKNCFWQMAKVFSGNIALKNIATPLPEHPVQLICCKCQTLLTPLAQPIYCTMLYNTIELTRACSIIFLCV